MTQRNDWVALGCLDGLENIVLSLLSLLISQ